MLSSAATKMSRNSKSRAVKELVGLGLITCRTERKTGDRSVGDLLQETTEIRCSKSGTRCSKSGTRCTLAVHRVLILILFFSCNV